MNPIQAIRKQCLQCMGGSRKEVNDCTTTYCSLHRYRMGKDSKPISPKRRAQLLQNLKGGKK